MLSEEISECFSGEFWKRAARLIRNGFYCVPSVIIELDLLTCMATAHHIRPLQTMHPYDAPMNCAHCHRPLISIDTMSSSGKAVTNLLWYG